MNSGCGRCRSGPGRSTARGAVRIWLRRCAGRSSRHSCAPCHALRGLAQDLPIRALLSLSAHTPEGSPAGARSSATPTSIPCRRPFTRPSSMPLTACPPTLPLSSRSPPARGAAHNFPCARLAASTAALSPSTIRESFYRAGGGEADESLPLVEIAAVGGLSPAETCHVVLHELAHVLAPDAGHGSAWRYAARQVGLLRPCAWPGSGALADWREIAPAIRATLQAIPEPTESLPAEYYDDRLRRPCAAGYGTRGGTSRGEGPAVVT